MSVELLIYREHEYATLEKEASFTFSQEHYIKFFKKRRGEDLSCFSLKKDGGENYTVNTGYFIGADWIEKNKCALLVSPKLQNVNYINMLLSSLQHPEVEQEVEELFEVDWDMPGIEIEQQQDLLTPFLVVEFLGLVKRIVRKGLKKSYYKVERNLNSRIKGKVLIGKTIKSNIIQNKNLLTYCNYDEFGYNNKENRLLKKALTFVKRYLPSYAQFSGNHELQNTFNYINPAFQEITDEIDLNEIKHSKINAFYKEYGQAIKLAKHILRRFGYNITNTEKDKISTPPFWIDMSKLFELHVLGLLKDRFHHDVKYQYKHAGNELDYLLKSDDYRMVIDAKYKPKYSFEYIIDDIRQVCGYARLNHIYKYLEVDNNKIIDCLIIYPDQDSRVMDLNGIEINSDEHQIDHYNRIFKLGVKLPELK